MLNSDEIKVDNLLTETLELSHRLEEIVLHKKILWLVQGFSYTNNARIEGDDIKCIGSEVGTLSAMLSENLVYRSTNETVTMIIDSFEGEDFLYSNAYTLLELIGDFNNA